ncbi:hypothetical protein BS78_K000900 [Paspalum vaginatum]|uniref:Uncharacterized protein n=1 Tax=Paspalum vaginatum TaxID=158149 RepID=A0A9W7XAT6_9POAL|nr:hypothetical protein BS78_K000900 [Paspalum vaginatum]
MCATIPPCPAPPRRSPPLPPTRAIPASVDPPRTRACRCCLQRCHLRRASPVWPVRTAASAVAWPPPPSWRGCSPPTAAVPAATRPGPSRLHRRPDASTVASCGWPDGAAARPLLSSRYPV